MKYLYEGCRWPFPQRITGDGYARWCNGLPESTEEENAEFVVGWTPGLNEQLVERVQRGETWNKIADYFYTTAEAASHHYRELVRRGEAPPKATGATEGE